MANKIKEARKDTSTQDEEENITIKLIDVCFIFIDRFIP